MKIMVKSQKASHVSLQMQRSHIRTPEEDTTRNQQLRTRGGTQVWGQQSLCNVTFRPKKALLKRLSGTNTQNQFTCSFCMLSLTLTHTHTRKALPISFWDRQWAITCSISPGLRWSNLTWVCWTTSTAEELHVSVHETCEQEVNCLYGNVHEGIRKVWCDFVYSCSVKTFFRW